MSTRRWVLVGSIFLFSILTLYSALDENRLLTFPSFLLVLVASLVLYQSFDHLVPRSNLGIFGYFIGRLIFLGFIVYGHTVMYQSLIAEKLDRDGIRTYGIVTGISSAYMRGKWTFFRHFVYYANGKQLENKVRFSNDLNRGDTIYLRYSKSKPHIIQFEDNRQNRLHGLVK